jgi:SET and MYND domain-containing protein
MKSFADMANTGEERLVLYAQMANLVQMMVDSNDVKIKEVTKDFCRFACNAHTICDEEMRPLGTGLYPVISIINHSCSPNAVLHFDGKHAVVRALENINKGTEVNSITLEHSVGLSLLHAMESSRRSI